MKNKATQTQIAAIKSLPKEWLKGQMVEAIFAAGHIHKENGGKGACIAEVAQRLNIQESSASRAINDAKRAIEEHGYIVVKGIPIILETIVRRSSKSAKMVDCHYPVRISEDRVREIDGIRASVGTQGDLFNQG